jgi:3' exoribonuclease, RNase T-like
MSDEGVHLHAPPAVARARSNERQGSRVIVFLDTEFTGLVDDPQLLSVGIVVRSDARCEFYAEVTDAEPLRAASAFARQAVLPQFGKIAGAACSHTELGRRLSSFMTSLSRSLKAGETIEVAFESDRDWQFFERAINDSGGTPWKSVAGALRPVNVYNMAGFAVGELAAEAYFEAQRQALLSRHHALCDARALRIAFDAANASTAAATALAHSASPLSHHDGHDICTGAPAAMTRLR